MTRNQKGLKITLIVEIVFGLIIACFLALFVGIMATDSPKSTIVHFILGSSVGFLIVFLPSVLLPFLSIKEVNRYAENRKLTLNIINAIIVLVLIFFPLAIVQFYFIYKMREE